MTLHDVAELCVSLIGLVWFCTGGAIWCRWGWVGVARIWRERKKLDAIVRRDVEEQSEVCR